MRVSDWAKVTLEALWLRGDLNMVLPVLSQLPNHHHPGSCTASARHPLCKPRGFAFLGYNPVYSFISSNMSLLFLVILILLALKKKSQRFCW